MAVKKRAVSPDQKEERWGKILDAAQHLFVRHPYAQISMDQIALKSGVAKGTVYLYFKSKEDLFLDLKTREYGRWFDEIDAALASAPSSRSNAQRIEAFIGLLLQSLESRADMIRLIVSLHDLFERNISPEHILDFHRSVGKRILHTGALLESRFPFLKSGDGTRFLLQLKAIIIGLTYVAQSQPALKPLSDGSEPELAVFQVEYATHVETLIRTVLKGLGAFSAV